MPSSRSFVFLSSLLFATFEAARVVQRERAKHEIDLPASFVQRLQQFNGGDPCVGDPVEYYSGYGDCASYKLGKTNHHYCDSDENEEGQVPRDVCVECGVCTDKEDKPPKKKPGKEDKPPKNKPVKEDEPPKKKPTGPTSAGDVSCASSKSLTIFGEELEAGKCKKCLYQQNNGLPFCYLDKYKKAACQPEEGSVWCGKD